MDPFDLRLWPGFQSAGGDLSAPAIIDQVAIDSRRIDSKHCLFVALPGTQHDGHSFVSAAEQHGARYALVNQDWDPSFKLNNLILLKVASPLAAFQEIAGRYRASLPVKIIGISGSYGKTMVKDLLYEMLETTWRVTASPESFNSQIGVPLSLFTIRKEHQIALIEAAISQKNEMKKLADIISPDFTILTHIGKKHVRTLGSLEEAAVEKLNLIQKTPEMGWTLLPNTPLLKPLVQKVRATLHHWNEENPLLPQAKKLHLNNESQIVYRVDFPNGYQFEGMVTTGFYYFLDLVNMTVKAAWLMGVPAEKIAETLKNYHPEPMRTEIWKSPIGSTFINDTYCSDPQSVDKALKHFEQNSNSARYFIFGGIRSSKKSLETDYKRIGQAIKQSKIQKLMLVGNHPYQPLVERLSLNETSLSISSHASLEDAFEQLRPLLKNGDSVLIKGEKKASLDLITEAFEDSVYNNQCLINLAAIEENIELFRHRMGHSVRIMVMVKALAYGTDEIRIAKFLENCEIDILGVSYVDEGVALKRAGVKQAIFVINGAVHEASKAVKWDLEIGVSEKGLVQKLGEEALLQNKKIKVHLHIDTGMSRFGCRPEEALELAKVISEQPMLVFEGVMTHFACAENPAEDPFTLEQAHKFLQIVDQLKQQGYRIPWIHAANSSGALRFNFPEFNMVRLGLAIYGLHTSKACEKVLDLRLALSLISRIVGINICRKGETISYGRSYKVEKEIERIAILPIGYFDGLHRNYSGKGHVIIRGRAAPMVGKICMDFMMVDITNIPDAVIGDPVLVFGEDEYGNYLSLNEFADKGNSIVHELITCLGPRIQRIFIHEEGHKIH